MLLGRHMMSINAFLGTVLCPKLLYVHYTAMPDLHAFLPR